ncbi:MAG: Maf family protein [Pseudomonadota bacterium]|nr:Maf family protein [Pseudomonadota bacterium]
MPQPPIVLASTSPARLALFRAAGIACTGVAPDVDESRIQAPTPPELAMARAAAKAGSIQASGAVVIGADQVAHLDGAAFGKPTSVEDHRTRLRQLRGRTHTLTTAVVLILDARRLSLQVDAHVRFRADLTDAELDAYVATGEGSGCAGGYAVEGLGANLIAAIDGDYFGVLGIPVLDVLTALRGLGWRPTFPPPPS